MALKCRAHRTQAAVASRTRLMGRARLWHSSRDLALKGCAECYPKRPHEIDTNHRSAFRAPQLEISRRVVAKRQWRRQLWSRCVCSQRVLAHWESVVRVTRLATACSSANAKCKEMFQRLPMLNVHVQIGQIIQANRLWAALCLLEACHRLTVRLCLCLHKLKGVKWHYAFSCH